MKLKFYGTRGSIPTCDAGFQQFGDQPAPVREALEGPGSGEDGPCQDCGSLG